MKRYARRARLGLVAVGGMLPVAMGLAQSDAEILADMRKCANIESSSARLACFDGVLGRARHHVPGVAARRAQSVRLAAG
jgi:hypothetical protein